MELRLWRSFSCNNSSSYYLVARFDSAEKATTIATEVRDFLTTHATQKDRILDDGLDDWEAALTTPTAIQEELARQHGFVWGDSSEIFWGDSELAGDEPVVSSVGPTLFVFHGYCAGGLEFLNPLISARGGRDIDGDPSMPLLNVIARSTDDAAGAAKRAGLADFFAQRGSTEYMDQWDRGPFLVDHMVHTDDEELIDWTDGVHIGFSMRVDDELLVGIRAWLNEPGITDAHMTLEDSDLRRTLETLNRAKHCPECRSAVRYVPVDASDNTRSESQLVCQACGGMFALSSVAAGATPSTTD